MTSLEILLNSNCEISVDVYCPKCEIEFSTELDSNQNEDNIPTSIKDVLYCHNCEKAFEYTATSNSERYKLVFKDERILASIKHSEKKISEDFEILSPKKSKNFYYLQIDRLKILLEMQSEEFIIDQSLNRLIFSGIVTVMETYLNEILNYVVFYSENTLQKFVENYEPYKNESLTLNEIFTKQKKIKSKVREDVNNLLYHNIAKLINIFNIFDFELVKFKHLKNVARKVQLRHNFIHRSGVDKNDGIIEVSKSEVYTFILETNSLVEYINKKIDENCFSDEIDFIF